MAPSQSLFRGIRSKSDKPTKSQKPITRIGSFDLKPLPSSDWTRLLLLHPGRSDEPIRCSLETTKIRDAKPYEAISYTWGFPPNPTSINCDGKEISVTLNLVQALRQLRQPDKVRVLWADAVCINQNDKHEKSVQVSNMTNIYRNASQTIVWLGEEDEITQSAFSLAEIITKTICRALGINFNTIAQTKDLRVIATEFVDFDPSQMGTRAKSQQRVAHPFRQHSSTTPDHATALRQLPLRRSHHWRDLQNIYNRPWFERTWVVREVQSSRTAIAVCGARSVNYDCLALAAEWLMAEWSQGVEFGCRPICSQLRTACWIRRRGVENYSILRLLRNYENFEAGDPRDKVFAIVQDGTWKNEHLPEEIRPDYEKTTLHVYEDVVKYTLRVSSELDIFANAGYTNDPHESFFPSWVPQWDKKRAYRNHLSIFFTASGHSKHTYRPPVNHILPVTGFQIGSVKSMESAMFERHFSQNNETPPDVVAFWTLLVNLARQTVKPGQMDLWTTYALCMTAGYLTDKSVTGRSLFHNRGWTGQELRTTAATYAQSMLRNAESPDKTIGNTMTMLQSICPEIVRANTLPGNNSSSQDTAGHEIARHMCSEFEHTCHSVACYRRLFTTAGRSMGLGPASLLPNDQIWILYGGKTPYVLRPKGNHYRLIGECYLQGMMHGEAMTLQKTHRIKEQSIGLC
ncbi:hypothetical protein K402DRAFT_402594 [Aulographum hederae CBS 113979]|uniref:Heterokaryon incompatibility domain-containing protein n=1 Tax=Aulographum hederae CBS 113979 TaxID=1176131 RepID=A0A6G1H6Q9_9PEZI|nr:hypothetical protein K402DRAFT_402594 [Aulographum hederae CBS 113979]